MLSRRKHQNIQGFTWIELLVVIAVIGILAAIALPSFLNQARKEHPSEPTQYVGTLLRSQQAFFLDEGRFASSFAELKTPVPVETKFYFYSIRNYKTKILIVGKTNRPALKSNAGGVFLRKISKNEMTAEAILCVAKQPGTQPIAPPIDAKTCGEGTIKVGNN
jgi:type IV pilus assembly protein PilA